MNEQVFFDGVEIREIPGYPDYFVSAHGAVFSCRPRGTSKVGKMRPMKCYVNRDGYRQFTAQHDGKISLIRVNRSVASAWIGLPPDEESQCCHRNGNRLDDHFENLRWDTPLGNNDDKALHGTYMYGETHPRAVLTAEQVQRIRDAKANAKSNFWGRNALAKEFGVSVSTVKAVLTGQNWSFGLRDKRDEVAAAKAQAAA